MNIRLTKHAIKQIHIRKYKSLWNDKKSIMFWLAVFEEMIEKQSYKWNKINKRRWKKVWSFIISEKVSWYKFVYIYDRLELEYIVLTFSIKTELDFSIWKILKNLHIK